jgi:hypothetical protein
MGRHLTHTENFLLDFQTYSHAVISSTVRGLPWNVSQSNNLIETFGFDQGVGSTHQTPKTP